MKRRFLALILLGFVYFVSAQTKFEKSSELFRNGESVWTVVCNSQQVGEFWPIHGLNLVSKDIDPSLFGSNIDIKTIQKNLGGIATAPDGMTGGSLGAYQMQGKCLSHGRPCGDGFTYQYGVICVSPNGYSIKFTHMSEIKNFDSLYNKYREIGATIFFLPSLFRNGEYLSSEKVIDKVLIRRETPYGEQIGVIIFNHAVTYNEARKIITGLDRKEKDGTSISKTTHIYVLDGGPYWGQSCKEVNNDVIIIGSRDPRVVTNYLVFYP